MTAALARIALFAALALPAAALAARSDWSAAERSQLRLLLSTAEDGRYRGGIEIVLEPEWYTYWRNPGEAGIPPRFDFSGSENVAGVEVLYPAPERHDDGTSLSLIYRDEVVFPLLVTPVEAERPVVLKLAASYGVCREVCIPTSASATVATPPAPEPDALTEARLRAYMSRVPGPAEPGRFEVEPLTVEGDSILVDVRMPDSTHTALFADPPAGWYVGQPSFVSRANGVSRYRLDLDDRPQDATLAGQEFRFVAVSGGEAIEDIVEIPPS
jgi:DsbC/DsbD-like thiol-disulfide interchange protein